MDNRLVDRFWLEAFMTLLALNIGCLLQRFLHIIPEIP